MATIQGGSPYSFYNSRGVDNQTFLEQMVFGDLQDIRTENRHSREWRRQTGATLGQIGFFTMLNTVGIGAILVKLIWF
ncbi:MAG: hypothetical protein WD229_17440 [Pirellulales bacterium]